MKEALNFALSLQKAAKAFLLYGAAKHPRTTEAIETLIDHTEAMFIDGRVQVVASRGSLFVHGQLVNHHSNATDWLIEGFRERRINGFLITKGVTGAELLQVVKMFTLKPQQLEAMGGPDQLLAEVDAANVRVSQTRYEEIRDGEIVAQVGPQSSTFEEAASPHAFDAVAAFDTLASGKELAEKDADKFAKFLVDWIQAKRKELERGDQTSPGITSDAARRDMGPDMSTEIVRFLREQPTGLSLIEGRMKSLGISREELDEVIDVVVWDGLTLDQRLDALDEGASLFALPVDKVTGVALELVNAKRPEDAANLVERLAAGLFAPEPEHRKRAAGSMQRIVGWIIDPGLPRVVEAILEKQLLTHFVKETDPQIQRRSQIALMRLYDTWILRSQFEKAIQVVRRLDSVATAASSSTPWKRELYDELLDRLMNEDRIRELLDLMHTQDLETINRDYYPVFAFYGGRAAVRLLEVLEVEEDRSKRGRLIKAIKAIGKPALHHLEQALKSPTWYLVRNALNVLGDLTAVELIDPMIACLEHDDDRVRRAAARALGKLAGVRVERALIDALKENGPETQVEILAALASLKAESAIEPLVEFTKPRKLGRTDDPVRLKALETIGAIGSQKGVAPLAELLHRKGVLSGHEPPIARKTICFALLAIGSLEAYKEVQAVAETDPDPEVRAELQKALWH